MKKKTYVLLGILAAGFILFVFAGCNTGGDSPYAADPTAFAELDPKFNEVGGFTAEAMDYRYDKEDTTKTVEVQGYKLSDIISESEVEAKAVAAPEGDDLRPIFSYEVWAEDGYPGSADRFIPVSWTNVKDKGYYLYDPDDAEGEFSYTDPDTSETVSKAPRTAYDVSLDKISSGYYVKDPEKVKLYRSVSITVGEEEPFLVHISGFETTEIEWSDGDNNFTHDAVALDTLLQYYIDAGTIPNYETATYELIPYDYDPADPFSRELAYSDLTNAYFVFNLDADNLIDYDRVVVLNEDMQTESGRDRIKYVTGIVIE
jgi:hypothetical protein